MKNKKGLSTIVTTLIIVALSLVAVGVVWLVVNNIVNQQTSSIDYSAKCLNLEFRAIAGTECAEFVENTTLSTCTVIIQREKGDDAIGGIRLIFSDTSGASPIVLKQSDEAGNIATTETYDVEVSDSANPTVVEVTPYLTDNENVKHVCSVTTKYNLDYSS